MLKKILTSKAVKQFTVFAAVFVLGGFWVGERLVAGKDIVFSDSSLSSFFNSSDSSITVNIGESLRSFFSSEYDREPYQNDYSYGIYTEGYRQSQDSGFVFIPQIPLSESLQLHTFEVSIEQGIEYEVMLALIWRESRFQPSAVNINRNGTRDSGIMQINDVNRGWLAVEYGITDLMDPYQNILAGAIILGRLYATHDVYHTLMAYQLGEQGMLRRVSQGASARDFVYQTLQRRDYYRRLTANAKEELSDCTASDSYSGFDYYLY